MGVSVSSSSSSSLAGSSKTIDSRKDEFVDEDDAVVVDDAEDVVELPKDGLSVLRKCLNVTERYSCYCLIYL